MIYVDRLFAGVDLLPKAPGADDPFRNAQRLDEFEDFRAIVVLGEPGAGKTTAFQKVAEANEQRVYVDLRRFLRATELAPYSGKTIYIDALDEARSRLKGDTATLDSLINKLESLGRPPFRLSCRSLDWYGSADLRQLADASSDSRIAVVALQPLSDADITTIVGDAGRNPISFIKNARRFGVFDLMRNPESLKLLLEVVVGDTNSDWPASRTELYEKASLSLLREDRETHKNTHRGAWAPEELIDSAGRLCAVALCSNQLGFALHHSDSDEHYPVLGQVAPADQRAEAALHRRLFPAPESGRVSLPHRTIAEYLAARHLLHRVRKDGLPLTRAVALMTIEGGTIASLRGLYAYFSSLAGPDADALMRIDPIAVIQQGDPSRMPLATRQRLFELLGEMGRTRPWAVHEGWDEHAFGRLGTPDMAPFFQDLLQKPSPPDYAVIAVYEAITHAPEPLHELEEVVRWELWKPERTFGGRAIRAFSRIVSDPTAELRRLLDAIRDGKHPDDQRQLRGRLLSILYPQTVRPHELPAYFTPSGTSFSGAYEHFLYRALELTPDISLPELLDAISAVGLLESDRRNYRYARLVGKALQRILEIQGEAAPASRLLSWLRTASDDHGHSILRAEDGKSIAQWFEAHPRVALSLLDEQLSISRTAEPPAWFWWDFAQVLCMPANVPGLGDHFLERAAAETDERWLRALFREAAALRFNNNRADAPSVEALFAFAERHPAVSSDLIPSSPAHQALTYVLIPDWRQTHAARDAHERQATEAQRQETLRRLPAADLIRSGQNLNTLHWLGQVYWERDGNESGEDAITKRSSPEIAAAALAGFVALVRGSPIHSPKEIGKTYADNRHWTIGHAILAGIDQVARTSETELMSLPEGILAAGLCYRHTNFVEPEPRWPDLVAAQNPSLVARALLEFWQPLFTSGKENLPGLYALGYSSDWDAVAEQVALPILQERVSEKMLPHVLAIALRFGDSAQLLAAAEARIACETDPSRFLWCTAAAILAPTQRAPELIAYLGGDTDKAQHALKLAAEALWPEHGRKSPAPSLQTLASLVAAGCSAIPPSLDHHGFHGEQSQLVQALIDRLAAHSSKEAGIVLSTMLRNSALAAWHQALTRAADAQAKIRREREFNWPTPALVMQALDGGGPASRDDLLAVLESEIRHLSRDIRDTATSPYRQFWNIPLGRNDEPKPRPENYCRDYLFDLLKERLRRFNVVVETEARYADDKRGDTKAISGDMALPIEAKRHYNKELWTAPTDQLIARYARDPASEGRGLYVVFWFGLASSRSVPKPPTGVDSSSSVSALEDALRLSLTSEQRQLIRVICIDVAWPAKSEKQKKRNSKRAKKSTRPVSAHKKTTPSPKAKKSAKRPKPKKPTPARASRLPRRKKSR